MRPRRMLALSLIALAACATPSKPRYYALSGGSPQAAATVVSASYRVAIGPVTIPEAVDRPQLVLRLAPHRYAIADDAHWLAPLKSEISRVIAQDLGQGLPAARVMGDMQNGGHGVDYRVSIDVLRFESVPGASITLETAWSVRNRAGKRLHQAHSLFVEPVGVAGVAALVDAHAAALAALAREIALAVKAVTREKR